MTFKIKGYAAYTNNEPLRPFEFERREPRENDVEIRITHCGVCHSDIHQVKNEWGGSRYPMVPGHEIVGVVTRVGEKVTKFKVGDHAGVGCLVDSCLNCASCDSHLEQFCQNGSVGTYNSIGKDGQMTYGGYSQKIVVREEFTLKIPKNLPLAPTAPLLCAGITTYSPLRHWKVSKGMKVAVVGLGGLGHMGVKFAHAFGAEVYVFSKSPKKRDDALKLGAKDLLNYEDEATIKAHMGTFDFILDTVSAPHDLNTLLRYLKNEKNLVLVGLPDVPPTLQVGALIWGRKSIAGSLIGGIKETQEMLDFCGEHNIVSEIELIKMSEINTAYERMLKSDVKYRFVIDNNTI